MTHVFGIFVVAGMTGAQMMLWWGTSTRPRPLAGLLGATRPLLFSLVLSVGWSLLMQTRIELIMESFWTTEAAVGSLLSSYRSVLDEWAWIAIGVLSMLFRQGQPSRRGAAIAIVTVAATVTVGPGLVSFLTEGGHHFVFPRYLLAVVPCAALAGGFALSRMGWVPGIACILWIFWVPLVQPNMRLYSPTAHYGHDTRSASILLANRTREGDEIAVLPSWNYLTFEYYGFNVPVRGDAVWTLLNRWNAGEIRNRLWIVDYDGRLARSARFERLGGCTHQRLYGIDFYLCKS
jgi:hypothetical protein